MNKEEPSLEEFMADLQYAVENGLYFEIHSDHAALLLRYIRELQ